MSSFKKGDLVKVKAASYHYLKDNSQAEIINEGVVYMTVLGISKNTNNKITQTILLKDMTKIKAKAQSTDILSVATNLARANNTVTTLEIKTELRKNFNVTQDEVHRAMINFAQKGLFSFKDNGTYRIYSLVKNVKNMKKRGLVKGSATALAAGAKAAATRAAKNANVITRQKAHELMKNSKGQFFTVEYLKKDRTERTLNGQYVVGQNPNALGYVLVKESGKLKKGENPIRNVNLQTLKSLKIKGVQYKVK